MRHIHIFTCMIFASFLCDAQWQILCKQSKHTDMHTNQLLSCLYEDNVVALQKNL